MKNEETKVLACVPQMY